MERMGLGEGTFFISPICRGWRAVRNILETVMKPILWAVAERVRWGGLRWRKVEFAWQAWMLPGHRYNRRVATRQAVFRWTRSTESCRLVASWILRAWGCPVRRAADSRLYNKRKPQPCGVRFLLLFGRVCLRWAAIYTRESWRWMRLYSYSEIEVIFRISSRLSPALMSSFAYSIFRVDSILSLFL